MTATSAVRSKHLTEQNMIDDSASDYYQEKEEQARQAAEKNARNSIIEGIHPQTGEALSLEEHARQLDAINAASDDWHTFNTRVTQAVKQNAELEERILSQYPCSCCEERAGGDWRAAGAPKPGLIGTL